VRYSLHLSTGSTIGAGGNERTGESDGDNHSTAVAGEFTDGHELHYQLRSSEMTIVIMS